MLQNTKARHIPSSRMKTETTQKQNLSLAVSQAERALECQERAQKGEGAEQQKRGFLRGQQCAPVALWREAEGCEGGQNPPKDSKELLFPLTPLHPAAWAAGLLPKNQDGFDL